MKRKQPVQSKSKASRSRSDQVEQWQQWGFGREEAKEQIEKEQNGRFGERVKRWYWPVGPDDEEQPSGRRRDSTDSPVPNGMISPGEFDEAIIRVAQMEHDLGRN